MKKGVILLALVMILSFTSAFTVNFANYSLKQEYGIDEPLSGTLNLSIENISVNSKFSSDLGEMTLREFLKENEKPLSCEIFNCTENLRVTNNGELVKQVQATSEEKTLGLLVTGDQISVKSFNITFSSTFPEKNRIPLLVSIGDSYIWKYDKPSANFNNPKDTTFGCFNESASLSHVDLGTTPYCEKVTLEPSKSYLLGAKISGAGTVDLIFTLKDKYLQDKATCTLPKPSATYDDSSSNCQLNFSEQLEKGEYYVCIKATSDSIDYTLKSETSGTNCGFYGTNNGNLQFDYSLYVKTPKYSASAGPIELPESFKESSINSINTYLQKRYSSSCSEGCVVPIKILGDSTDINISNIKLSYGSIGGQISTEKIYETSLDDLKADVLGELNLEKLNWKLTSAGEKEILIEITDGEQTEEIVNSSVEVKTLPRIMSISPLNPPAGIEILFYANVQNKGNSSSYKWDFGDGTSILTTTKSFAKHTYQNISAFNLSLTFETGNYSTSKSFIIDAISPENYLNETIISKKVKLAEFLEKVAVLPVFYRDYATNFAKTASLKLSLEEIEMQKAVSSSSEDYLSIAQGLSQLIIPVSIEGINKKTGPIVYTASAINPIFVKQATEENVSVLEEYNQAIFNWQVKNIVSKLTKEDILLTKEDGSKETVLTTYEVNITSKYNADSYLIIQEDLNNLHLPQAIAAIDIEDRATAIEIGANGRLYFNFFTANISSPVMFVSPKLSAIFIPTENPNCNYNSLCDSNENYKLCRSDCYPVLPTVLWLIVIVFVLLIVYTIIQVWYKIRYENYLFSNRESLFNLISFINSSHQKNTSDTEIEKALLSQGWSKEQISYAIRKSEGKNTGMFEIIPIEKIIAYREKKKIEELKTKQMPTPKPTKQNFQNQFRR